MMSINGRSEETKAAAATKLAKQHLLFLAMVAERYDIIGAPISNKITGTKKQAAWEDIYKELVNQLNQSIRSIN